MAGNDQNTDIDYDWSPWNGIAGIVESGIPGEEFTIAHSMHVIESATELDV